MTIDDILVAVSPSAQTPFDGNPSNDFEFTASDVGVPNLYSSTFTGYSFAVAALILDDVNPGRRVVVVFTSQAFVGCTAVAQTGQGVTPVTVTQPRADQVQLGFLTYTDGSFRPDPTALMDCPLNVGVARPGRMRMCVCCLACAMRCFCCVAQAACCCSAATRCTGADTTTAATRGERSASCSVHVHAAGAAAAGSCAPCL
jgi:hypothetical protein